MKSILFRVVVLCALGMSVSTATVNAAVVADPDTVEVLGLLCRGDDGAAWVKAGGQEILVTPGFMLARDVRVTAIQPDGIVMYRPRARTYHVAKINLPKLSRKTRSDYLACLPMPLWKVIRMISFAYRKDFICHHTTVAETTLQKHGVDMKDLLDRCMYPHHRYHGRNGFIYVAPVHVSGIGWKYLLDQVQRYRSHHLARWFPKVEGKGTIVSNGRPLAEVLRDIAWKSGVPIRWDHPVTIPLYCSFKELHWHEILENIIMYNGLILAPTPDALVVSGPWPQTAVNFVPATSESLTKPATVYGSVMSLPPAPPSPAR